MTDADYQPIESTTITIGPAGDALSFSYPFTKAEAVKDSRQRERLTVDGVTYHYVDADRTPVGIAEVEVKIIDGANETPAMMMAGLAGSSFRDCRRSEQDEGLIALGEIHPVAAWWMFTTSPAPVEPPFDYEAFMREIDAMK
jgi:hypothetical protein